MLEMLTSGFLAVFTDPLGIAFILLGVMVGIIFGSLPGLTTVAALSMFLPITYAMSSGNGLSMLTAIYIGGISGGLISAILLNIPGTPSSIATCFEGVPMARKGQAGKALGLGIFASLVGTVIGILAMIVLSPVLAALTIKFGPWEYFSVTIFALTLISSLAGKSMIKGLLSALFGMMFATVGLSSIDSAQRFTFGSVDLSSGFNLLAVLVGLYAISEVLTSADSKQQTGEILNYKMKGLLGFRLRELKGQTMNFIRSSLIGLGIGILPGIGASSSNLIAYSVTKNVSKHPEQFGTGIQDGIISTESSNNSSIGGAMIPLLTLGIPGDGATAILLGGFMLHGLQPGPLLFQTNGDVVYHIFASMIVASFIMALIMYAGMRFLVKILEIPSYILLPIIIVLCLIGAYALNNRVFDMWSLLVFGIIGLSLSRFGIPAPPFILGFILENAMETNLRRGVQYANGDLTELFNHPIALFFLALTVLSIVLTVYRQFKKKA
ncbi:putative tricarboxylic transport membrane protein [Cricetibacter osteomyelitidis]|uniref:Putative tricarboxylic transport membrane protein n=1 Tax=Cricetibacter osteomyelitidis TaxID=1521931 RepID=A0A4R2TA38_9PAST|nr:tripartite tricarboxylate transporter permease [Cricetibacter osteomyelitidis]TCP97734.1 putative tricarboxylic transport membrane protein [Cricetibacter osteomyelitidis]